MIRKTTMAAAALLFGACETVAYGSPIIAEPTQSPAETASTAAQINVHPMTIVNAASGQGYFQDPYPIHTAANGRSGISGLQDHLNLFSGTTRKILACSDLYPQACFAAAPVDVDPGVFAAQTQAAGSTINNFEGMNIYQGSKGVWHMAVTAHLKNAKGAGWNVILHAHATKLSYGVPTAWEADQLLVGDLGTPAPDNYDGKYFEDGGVLYLIYNTKVGDKQDGVVAQAMKSFTKAADQAPVPLLGPETQNGGYRSELAQGLGQNNGVKLVETGNITKIDGKYVMTYSVGTFNRPDYKAGIAWSDSFLPKPGTYYQRVLQNDATGVWGVPGHAEVKYLVQSQLPQWPHYIGRQVLAPGVPAIVQDAHGDYCLTFAGYAPSDAPTNAAGLYEGPHRRPYFIKLDVRIPANTTVSGATPQALASWIQPRTHLDNEAAPDGDAGGGRQ